jgi:hypothetical protein
VNLVLKTPTASNSNFQTKSCFPQKRPIFPLGPAVINTHTADTQQDVPIALLGKQALTHEVGAGMSAWCLNGAICWVYC